MLIIVGAFIALLVEAIYSGAFEALTTTDISREGYQEILIAPIILKASYALFHPHFFGQIRTILMLAIIGTVLQVVVICPIVLYIYDTIDPEFKVFDSLTFAALISAVVIIACL